MVSNPLSFNAFHLIHIQMSQQTGRNKKDRQRSFCDTWMPMQNSVFSWLGSILIVLLVISPCVGRMFVHLRSLLCIPHVRCCTPQWFSLIFPLSFLLNTPLVGEKLSQHQEVLLQCPHAFQYGFAPRKRRKGQGRNFDRHSVAKVVLAGSSCNQAMQLSMGSPWNLGKRWEAQGCRGTKFGWSIWNAL